MAPGKLIELYRFGEDGAAEPGIATGRLSEGFFSFLGFPRVQDAEVVRKAIARGVEAGLLGYATGRPTLGEDGRYRLDRTRIAFERNVADEEIDLDSGFIMIPAALPERPVEPSTTAGGEEAQTGATEPAGLGIRETPEPYVPSPPSPATASEHEIVLSFTADREALFHSWNALANLADLAGTISIKATATKEDPFDKGKLENGVLEPLRELGLMDDDD